MEDACTLQKKKLGRGGPRVRLTDARGGVPGALISAYPRFAKHCVFAKERVWEKRKGRKNKKKGKARKEERKKKRRRKGQG